MLHTLAQTGGGGGWGGFFNPATVKLAAYVAFGLIALLGGVFKKISEKNAQRAAELARERRREEMLRTGRDETGAFVDVTKVAVLDAAPTASSPSADEAKARLQQLAERRRRELAEMMKRSATAGGSPEKRSAGTAPGTQVPSTQVARTPQPQSQQARKQSEQQARRQKELQEKAARKAAAATARREQEQALRAPVAPRQPSQQDPIHAAYEIRSSTTPSAQLVMQKAANSQIGAAIARAGGAAPGGASPTSAAEWRKAIVLSELLHRPVSMRETDERTI